MITLLKSEEAGQLEVAGPDSELGRSLPDNSGRPISICFGESDRLDYFTYIPKSAGPGSPLLCAVHGLRRSAAQQVFQLKQWAEEYGIVVFAPLFARDQFRYFQTLTPNAAGALPEDAFDAALDDCVERFGLRPREQYLFGFSGGAQFAHRYTLIGSKSFDRLILMAPGWFSMPTKDLPYPYGIGWSEALGLRKIAVEGLSNCPTLVMVGERDTKRTASLNQDQIVDEHQGRNRVERCKRWIAAMQDQSADCQVEPLHLVKRGGHSLEKMLNHGSAGSKMFDWLSQ